MKRRKTDLSIIIINFNTADYTISCIKSIVKHTSGIDYEIIVIDNASKDESVNLISEFVRNYKNIILIKNSRNLGFSKANNIGIRKSSGRYILLLNSDTLVHNNIFPQLIAWLDKNPTIGVASCALKNEDGTMQGTGGFFPNLARVFFWMSVEDIPLMEKLVKPFHPMRSKSWYKNERAYSSQTDFDWLTGAFFLIRRAVIKDVGGLDEDYFMYTEDTDFCYRAKKTGWRVVYNPRWSITHFGGKSSSEEFPILAEFEGVKLFYKKHYPHWQLMFVRLFMKAGAFWRMFVFGLLHGRKALNTYGKAVIKA